MHNRVLIIDNYDSFTFNLRQIIEENQCNYKISKNDEISLDEAEQFEKILISPGPGLPDNAGLVKQLIKRYYSTKSILGVCLGHQAIAEVFGGSLFNFTAVHHGISIKIEVLDNSEYLFQNIPVITEVGLYHSWAVNSVGFPAELKITALSSDGIIMAISHKQYDVKGIQFHPESIMTNFGKQIIINWLNH